MKKKIKKFLAKIFKNKKVNPIIFPFIWLIFQFVDFIRVKSVQLNLKPKDKEISIQLQSNGFVTIYNFLENKDFVNLKRFLNDIKNNPNNYGWFESSNVETSIQFRPQSKTNNIIIKKINQYFSKLTGRSYFYLENILDIQSGELDGNCVFHTDIYRPTYKAWLYLKDVENFPFEYIENSNKNSINNFIFHMGCQTKYFLSNVINFLFKDKKLFLNPFGTNPGSWRIDYFPQNKFLKNPFITSKIKTFNLPSNTLLIANTQGMHRRSKIGDPNNPRESLMINSRTILF